MENYVRYRPGYPAKILDLLRTEAGLRPNWIVADIGSGTGILAEMFLKCGNTVTGVEPNDAMRAAAERLLRHYARFRSVKGTAEATGLPPASVDLVTAGQAFHWFDLDKARAEFLRILKPGGHAALVWNTRKTEGTPFLRAYELLLQRHSVDYRQVDHRLVTDEILGRFFAAFRKWTFANSQEFDLGGLKGRLMSASYAPLPGHPAFAPLMDRLDAVFREHAVDGTVRFDYATELYLGRLAAKAGRDCLKESVSGGRRARGDKSRSRAGQS